MRYFVRFMPNASHIARSRTASGAATKNPPWKMHLSCPLFTSISSKLKG